MSTTRRFAAILAADVRVWHFSDVTGLALQLPFLQVSESMGNHDSKIVDADSVD
jgi:hypothetical protein